MRKIFKVILLTCLLLLVGCKQANKEYYNQPPESTDPTVIKPGGETLDLSNHPALENRKIIYTVNLGIVSTNPSTAYNAIIGKLNSYDAFIESEEITSKAYKVKIRVKSTNLNGMVNSIQDNGETINYVKTSEDITNTYSTLQAKLSALQTQHARILELIDSALNLSDLLKLEDKRVEIEAQLNDIGSKLNNYDSLIDYSTIHLTITKIENISELLPKTTSPNIFVDQYDTSSVTIVLSNTSNLPTTMKIKVTLSGTLVKELTQDVYQNSKENVKVDGLKSGQQYKVEITSQIANHSVSSPSMLDIETERTFFKSVETVFITSLNALLALFKFIGLAIIGILPFAVTFTIIGIPVRIFYIKKIKNRKRS